MSIQKKERFNIKIFATPIIVALALTAVAAAEEDQRSPAEAQTPDPSVIGLALSDIDYLFYTTDGAKEECPGGFVSTSKQNWEVLYPTPQARKAHFDKCGGVDNRGPSCENVLVAPDLAPDPLPYRPVEGTKAYGVNLDGTADGRETATTCKHPKFTSPDGKAKDIDNQYYRLLGCQKQFHSELTGKKANKDLMVFGLTSRIYRTLLEIRKIERSSNDAEVEAVIYHGRDTLYADAQNNAVPWQSQRIDDNVKPQVLRGRIVDGELITEPADVLWPVVQWRQVQPILIRGMQLRLRLSEVGAEGLNTGYVDAESWWQRRREIQEQGSYAGDSAPALYAALHRLADGYKDPKTGACTALSSATKFGFTRVHIRHKAGQP